jgi:hypothetical protein
MRLPADRQSARQSARAAAATRVGRAGPVALASWRARERRRRAHAHQAAIVARERAVAVQVAAGAVRHQDWLTARQSAELPWLRTAGNQVRDEPDGIVYLRGVTARGLDASTDASSLAESLGLADDGVEVLTQLWNVTCVRLPFTAATVLHGTGSLAGGDVLSALDDLIAGLAAASLYVILALQVPTGAPVGEDVAAAWAVLAGRYNDQPAVLYELCAPAAAMPAGWWPDAATKLLGKLRRDHPASLVLLCGPHPGDDVRGLPLRYATGAPAPNIVYTVSATPLRQTVESALELQTFGHDFPVFVAEWTDGSGVGRTAQLAADVFVRAGFGWAAANWNAEPRLVLDAARRRFTPTRFGQVVQRALATPVAPAAVFRAAG